MRTCSIDGCNRPHDSRGWCGMHAQRWRRHGDPLADANLYIRGSVEERFWPRVNKHGPVQPHMATCCWEWTAGTIRGYGALSGQYAHRISWRIHFEDPGKMCVLHHCDYPKCVRPNHLFLGTRRDNADDAVAKRRIKHGSRHYAAKLTEDIVVYIRSSTAKNKDLAQEIGVDPSVISRVRAGKTWQHVPQ